MATVATSLSRHCFDRFDTPQGSPLQMDPSIGEVHLVPNPDFVFPARANQSSSATSSPTHKRPVSMHLNLSPPENRQRAQRQSVSALPTFTFNSTDTSGMGQNSPDLPSPTSTIPLTPSRATGHRRRASEFVGGDSRYGVSTLVSTSPSKLPESLPLPGEQPTNGSPARRRGHAHRRSTAISGHDLASILQPRDANAVSQPSLPTPPAREDLWMSPPTFSSEEVRIGDSIAGFGSSTLPQPDSPASNRPPSRPRVGFSENVEYIPRPLSTVSSDTTSSASTVRGHSVTNSISSVISLGGVGVPAPRRTRTPPNMDLRSASTHSYTSSFDSRPNQVRQELTWAIPQQRPVSQSAATSPNLSVTLDEPETSRLPSKKKNFLKLDRRRSEPLMGGLDRPGVSTVSLQDPVMSAPFVAHPECHDFTSRSDLNRKSSRRKVKDWASAFLGRKARDPRKTKSMVVTPDMVPSADLDIPLTPQLESADKVADAEIDLDALFGQDPFGQDSSPAPFSFAQNRSDSDLLLVSSPEFEFEATDDPSSIIDLDAALGPYGTPSMSGGRRQMHSGGFGRRGAERGHNRTYSLPTLTPFKFDRSSPPIKSSMADVFEEDEEIETVAPIKAVVTTPSPAEEEIDSDDESGTGIQIVEAVADTDEQPVSRRTTEHGLGIHRVEDPNMQCANLQPPAFPMAIRRTSIVEETILEEATSPIEIVEDHEEPRTSSVTKSSDSSEASTILADRHQMALPVPSAEPSPMSPASYATSTFSSPDYHSQQGFFDPTRLGTSASSITDNRTVSSFGQCDHGLDMRSSADDVPSLTSSRSTMISAFPRREFSDRSASIVSVPAEGEMSERRRKRSSIQSLSKLVGSQFGEGRNRASSVQRPQTAIAAGMQPEGKKRKENRLSKLMFWRSKGDSRSVSSSK